MTPIFVGRPAIELSVLWPLDLRSRRQNRAQRRVGARRIQRRRPRAGSVGSHRQRRCRATSHSASKCEMSWIVSPGRADAMREVRWPACSRTSRSETTSSTTLGSPSTWPRVRFHKSDVSTRCSPDGKAKCASLGLGVPWRHALD